MYKFDKRLTSQFLILNSGDLGKILLIETMMSN